MATKVYDLSQLSELAAGSDEFVESMIETFLEHTPGQLEEMLQAYEDGDLTVMGSIAHKIKPNIDLFRIERIAQDIRKVEEMGKDNNNDEGLKESLQRVEDVLRTSFKQMQDR